MPHKILCEMPKPAPKFYQPQHPKYQEWLDSQTLENLQHTTITMARHEEDSDPGKCDGVVVYWLALCDVQYCCVGVCGH